MKLFKMRKVVDEREEMEMLRIEHFVFWFVFWALLAGIFIQILFLKADFRQIAGEWCVFMMMAVCTVIKELKGGHFDYCTRPGWKAYLSYSLLAAAAVMLITVLRWMRAGNDPQSFRLVLLAAVFGSFAGVLTYACLAAAGAFVRYRRRKLEEQYEEE